MLGIRIRPGPAGPPPRRDPRLRLGRLPLHRLRPRVRLQRRAGRDAHWWRRCVLLGQAPVARGDAGSLATWAKFTPLMLGADAADLRPGPVTSRGRERPRRAGVSPIRAPLRLFAARLRRSSPSSSCSGQAIDPGLHSPSTTAQSPTRQAETPPSASGAKPQALEPLRIAILIAVATLALLFAFRPGEEARPGRGARRGPAHRRAADHAPLVLPIHRVVLPVAAGGDGDGQAKLRSRV